MAQTQVWSIEHNRSSYNTGCQDFYLLCRKGVIIPFHRAELHRVDGDRYEWHFIRKNFRMRKGKMMSGNGEQIVATLDERHKFKDRVGLFSELETTPRRTVK